MLDIIIILAVTVISIGMAYLGILLSLHPAETDKAKKRYKYAFGLLALFSIIFIGWQAYRTKDYQDQLSNFNDQQLKIDQKELDLKYEPSVDLIYEKTQLRIYNRGKTNLLFWGTKLDNGIKNISNEPRIISPSQNSFYYLLAENLEKEVVEKYPPNSQTYVPFEIYIENERSQKYIIKFFLFIVLVNHEVTIHTQNIGILEMDWLK